MRNLQEGGEKSDQNIWKIGQPPARITSTAKRSSYSNPSSHPANLNLFNLGHVVATTNKPLPSRLLNSLQLRRPYTRNTLFLILA